MKSFQFSLESVLEYRREIEQEWEQKLGAAVGLCNQLELKIDNLKIEERKALDNRDFLTAFQVQSWGLYRYRLRQNRERVIDELAKATKEMEKVRQGYLIAARDRKGLEKLKEKKLKEYKKYLIKQEFLEMDQITAAKAHRGGD